jgi:hypothetical protein
MFDYVFSTALVSVAWEDLYELENDATADFERLHYQVDKYRD